MKKKTVVILEIRDDLEREWWEALGLPDPGLWNDEDPNTFPDNDNAYVSLVLEREVAI